MPDRVPSTCRAQPFDGLTVTDAPAAACTTAPPPTDESCLPCDFCSDITLYKDCSGNGACTGGRCVCDDGWIGAVCDVNAAACPTGVQVRCSRCHAFIGL